MNSEPKDGAFAIGCNYWASNAGIYMWRRWDAACVKDDLQALKALGMNALRVFPLWPDFQPLERLAGGAGVTRGWAQRGGPLQNDACLDEENGRFALFGASSAKQRIAAPSPPGTLGTSATACGPTPTARRERRPAPPPGCG